MRKFYFGAVFILSLILLGTLAHAFGLIGLGSWREITYLGTNMDFTNWSDDDPVGWTVYGESGSDPMVTEVSGAARMYTSSAYVDITQAMIMDGLSCHITLDYTHVSGSFVIGSTDGGSDIKVIDSSDDDGPFDFTGAGDVLCIKRNTLPADGTFDNILVWCD